MTSANKRRSTVAPPRSFYRHVPFGPLVRATFVGRPNRFLVVARTARGVVQAACRDPGRLEELLVPGVELRLRRAPDSSARRTRYDLILARQGHTWVSLVPTLANDLLAAALARGDVVGLRGARVTAREIRRGRSRLDFLLAHRGRAVWTEVKSVGLVRAGLALFPDAPTERGARHLLELLELARAGEGAQVVFVVQRDDARAFAPFVERDPRLAQALAAAVRGGVRVRAYACRVDPRGATLAQPLRVRLARGARYDRRSDPRGSPRGER